MPETGTSAFSTFGDLLKYLRRRAQLTQRELAIAVGYTEGHISRLEKNQRLPDLATVAALFVPALLLEQEPETAARLLQLAASSHGDETRETSDREASIPSNLPIQLTTFIGRQAEIRELTELITGKNPRRLVTLTGPGGMGKTRLALQTTIGLFHLYRDGIWFVDLSPLSSPELIPQTVASALGVGDKGGRPVDQTLIESLRARYLLIVLDNCEHLIRASAQFVEKILRACAGVQVLATSREPLQVPGEVNFRVPPLSMPEDTETGSRNVMRHEAAQLFIERAGNVESTFTVTDANAPTIARICRQLDGMPLAIELAAARTTLLSLNQIESRLNDRFRLLTAGQTTLPRHQTLRATIEWSHDLLSEAEKILFRRLSVFMGGWTLEAANSVCSNEGHDVLDLLAQLINKSLVVTERQPDTEVRYNMLKTIREYAREQLNAADERHGMRSRHFDYFLGMAKEGEPKLFAAESSMDRTEAEIDNLRAALTWTLESEADGSFSEERTGWALELMTYVWPLWLSRGYLSEGNEWMKQLLAAHPAASPARARALTLAADFARYHGDYTGQAVFIQEALDLSRKLGDRKRIAWALMEMGLVERDRRQYSKAIPLLSESVGLFRDLRENLWVYRSSFLLAETYISDENLEAARPLWENGLELCREENDKWHIAWGLEGLGHLERLEGNFERAGQLYSESLLLKVGVMDKAGITYGIEAFAQLAASQKQFKRAVVLWGAGERLHQILNLLLPPSREKIYTSLMPQARSQLRQAEFEAAWAEGQAMNMQQAIQYALGI
jgi:non-specific serine/threonine protein kinase